MPSVRSSSTPVESSGTSIASVTDGPSRTPAAEEDEHAGNSKRVRDQVADEAGPSMSPSVSTMSLTAIGDSALAATQRSPNARCGILWSPFGAAFLHSNSSGLAGVFPLAGPRSRCTRRCSTALHLLALVCLDRTRACGCLHARTRRSPRPAARPATDEARAAPRHARTRRARPCGDRLAHATGARRARRGRAVALALLASVGFSGLQIRDWARRSSRRATSAFRFASSSTSGGGSSPIASAKGSRARSSAC